MKYIIRVLVSFIDKDTGKQLKVGERLETQSEERMRNILDLRLGELVGILHPRKKGKRVLIHQELLYKIGGIETANKSLARAFSKNSLTFVFNRADSKQFIELGKIADVVLDDGIRHYETDILILANYNSAENIIDRVTANKVYQQIHADFKGLMAMPEWKGFRWKPHERVDKVLAVSTTAQNGLKEALGVDSIVVPNILCEPEKKRLVFLVLSRATKEKGIDRLLDLVERFKQASKDFVVLLCSPLEQAPYKIRERIEAEDRILVLPASPYSQELLRSADYLVQLSANESYCYSVREALQAQVPIIVSDIPELRKLVKEGENGFVLADDMSNLDVDKIFNKIPKPKPYSEKISPLWSKILKGEL